MKIQFPSICFAVVSVTLGAIFGGQATNCLGQQDAGGRGEKSPVAQSNARPSPSANRQAIIAASSSESLSDAQFELLRQFILPTSDEAKWRETPWLPSIEDGRVKGTAQNRPLFVWAMNGDPLGCV